MRKRLYFGAIALMAIALFSAACSSSSVSGEDFGDFKSLSADSLPVRQIIAPSRWAICNDKAVVQSENTDSLFYVYSLPDFRFLYAWGRRGEGPGEYSAVTVSNAWDGDTGELFLKDYRFQRICKMIVGDRSFYRRDTMPVFPDEKAFSDDRPLAGGFLGTKKIPNGEQKEYFYVRSARDGAVLDSVLLATYVQAKYNDQGYMYSLSRTNTPRVIARGDRVALAYQNFRHIDIFRVSPQGRLLPVASVGETIDDAAIERMMASLHSDSQKGVVSQVASERFIYLLYVEFEVLDWDSGSADIRKEVLYAYDWEGHPAFARILERPVTEILVSRDDEYLYGRNEMEDFEQVYRYRF